MRTALVCLAAAFVLTGCNEPVTGVVVDKGFTAGGCTVVPVVGPKGGVSVGTACTSDTYTLIVQPADGEPEAVDVDKVTYVRAEVGDEVTA